MAVECQKKDLLRVHSLPQTNVTTRKIRVQEDNLERKKQEHYFVTTLCSRFGLLSKRFGTLTLDSHHLL